MPSLDDANPSSLPHIVGMQVLIPECSTLASLVDVLRRGEVITPDFAVLQALMAQPWDERKAARFAGAIGLPTIFAFDREYFGVTRSDAVSTDPQQRKLLETVVNCFFDAGITPELASNYTPVGCYVGAGVANYLAAAGKRKSSYFSEATRTFISNDLSALALRTSYFLNLQGPSLSILSTCSSSLVAFHHASRFLQSGEGHFAVAAGVNIDFETGYFPPEPGGILSPRATCRPLSLEADGTYFSNGICVALLATETAVRTFDLAPYCRIRASGVNNDGRRKLGYAAPSPDGQAALISAVSRVAGLTRRPDFVELHGTGTRVGDPIEMQALAQAYTYLPVSPPAQAGSVKSNFGHLNSSAGLLGLIKAALSLRHRKCFRTVGCLPLTDKFDFEVSGFRPATEELPLSSHEPLCAINSFGIGGTNAHVVLAGEESLPGCPTPLSNMLFVVGSHSPALVDRQLELLIRKLDSIDSSEWLNFAYTCNRLFSRAEHQSLVVYDSHRRLPIVLGDLRDISFVALPSGLHLGRQHMAELLCDYTGGSARALTDLQDVIIRATEELSLRSQVFHRSFDENVSHEGRWREMLVYLRISLSDGQNIVKGGNVRMVNGIQKAFRENTHIILD